MHCSVFILLEVWLESNVKKTVKQKAEQNTFSLVLYLLEILVMCLVHSWGLKSKSIAQVSFFCSIWILTHKNKMLPVTGAFQCDCNCYIGPMEIYLISAVEQNSVVVRGLWSENINSVTCTSLDISSKEGWLKKEIAAFYSLPTQCVTTHCGINALKFWAV